MAGSDPRKLTSQKKRSISGLFKDLPTNLDLRQFQLNAIYNQVRTEIANALEPVLNQQLTHCKPSPIVECRHLTSYVDALVSDLGLTVHIDGEPALLVAQRDSQSASGNGQYAVMVSKGNEKYERHSVSALPPDLQLIPAPIGTYTRLHALRQKVYSLASLPGRR